MGDERWKLWKCLGFDGGGGGGNGFMIISRRL